jgi:hypothetical protein
MTRISWRCADGHYGASQRAPEWCPLAWCAAPVKSTERARSAILPDADDRDALALPGISTGP